MRTQRKLFAWIMAFILALSIMPTAALADESVIEDISGKEWAVTSTDSEITMKLDDDNCITAKLADGTLTISGQGTMPNLNNSTETESGTASGIYPWYSWKDRITNIVIEDGITSIGSKAFIAYTSVTSVKIGKDVAEIGAGALSQLSACTNFEVSGNSHFKTDDAGVLYDSVQTTLIAFPCGSNAEECTIPGSVETIAYGAFSRAAKLKTLEISENSELTTIGYGAFAFTTALETVQTIPATLQTVGDLPFSGSGVKYVYCADDSVKGIIRTAIGSQLVDVLAPGETPAVEYENDGYTYYLKDGKAMILSAPKNEETPNIPETVAYENTDYPIVEIGTGAFAKNLNWSESSSSADNRNEAITSITIPANITKIGSQAFYFCKNLSTITVEAASVTIDDLAFATQGTTTVDLSKVTNLVSGSTRSWAGVEKIILNSESQLETIKSNVADKTIAVVGNNEWKKTNGEWELCPVTGLTATVNGIIWTFDALRGEATLTAYSPKETETIVVPEAVTTEDGETYTVTAIGKGLFGWAGNYSETDSYNTSIKSVTIPETVTKIGADAFRYSKNLKRVTIQGKNITFEKARTFSGASSLKVLDMSAVETVAFENDETSYFGNMGKATIYVSSEAGKAAIAAHAGSNNFTYAITDGGVIGSETDSVTSLYKPSKANYTFANWENEEGIYTAKWEEKPGQNISFGETSIEKHVNADSFTNVLTGAADGSIIVYTSSNESVATVDNNGLVTIKGAGEATITTTIEETATYKETAASYTLKVTSHSYTSYIYNNDADYEKDGTKTAVCDYEGCDEKDTVTAVGTKLVRTSSGGSSSSSSTTTVSVTSSKNGTVSASPKNAKKDDTVTLTVKPNAGYELDELTVTDKNGKTVKVTEGKNGKFTFTMPATKVTVEATFSKIEEAQTFIDVPDGYWAEDAIAWAAENGYMNGNSAVTFNPEGTVTRQQLWMILARLSGYQPADFTEAKAWAVDNGISDGTIPGNAVSRQQLVTILYRYAVRMGYNTSARADLTQFPDHTSVASYATDAMSWSVANGIVGGTTQGTLNPAGTATRAQFAVILMRFCDKVIG